MGKLFNDQGGLDRLAARLKAAKAEMPTDILSAHSHSSRHRSEIESSHTCGCFYCCETFPPQEICDWVDEGATALCPKCGIDSVLGSSSGLLLTKPFLEEMNKYWF
jgi:hypothetical protein